MASIFELKEQTAAQTPLLLFDCELANGTVERWSTHRVTCEGKVYEARVARHNLFEMEAWSGQGVDGIPRVSLALANADSRFSQIERMVGFKGARLTVRFVFYDVRLGGAASESVVLFQGTANPPEEITEAELRLTAVNRLGMQRVLLPSVRIQRRCPWEFPRSAEEREEGIYGGLRGRYSRFFRCGYSADRADGTGNLDGGAPYRSCGYTRADCEARGMFRADAAGRPTRRFGGIEFVPPSILVRSYGEKGWHTSTAVGGEARYNDFVPLVYGTAWYGPPVILARNDGNLTHMEVLLGMGEFQGVLKVLVNDIEIPQAQPRGDMTATGWYNVVSLGNRTGNFNLDFEQGDPYGSMAYLSVVVPNRINDGRRLPGVKVLAQGLRLPVYGSDGAYLRDEFTANPAWVLLDILQRSGWAPEEIDVGSFAEAAAYCGELIEVKDLYGNPRMMPRFECNLAVMKRRSAADLVRGIRNAARLFLTYGAGGALRLEVENTLALQQPVKPEGSNATEPLNGGWPAYCFGDGTNGTSGILRRANGEPAIRVWSRSMADTPNRFTVEFQDALNEYQQDSFSVVDAEDAARTGQEITAALPALGIAHCDQAARILKFHLEKSLRGNTYIDFETSVKALGLRPGDLISVTYLKEGFDRQPFRVLRIAPGANYRTVRITAQVHDDGWYSDTSGEGSGGAGREPGAGVGVPRPLAGNVVDENGEVQYEVTEGASDGADGTATVELTVGFATPAAPQAGGPGVPLVSLAATIGTGSLEGGQSLYYAVSGVDGEGRESPLSFTVHAAIPGGGGGYGVTLEGLSFAPGTAAFHVYRGPNPAQLRRIAAEVEPAREFTDAGLPDGTVPPPDANYDHANFYWRLELQPACAATIHSARTVGNEALRMEENEYRGMAVRILSGKGAGQERTVAANTASELTLTTDWTVEPDATSLFAVAEAGWRFGATAKGSPVRFEIPNRTGAVVQVSGRAANVNDLESPAELCTLTRWTVGGAGHSDADVPPAPVFALARGRSRGGTLELSAVSFADMTNTRTISAGTLSLYYWDELQGPPEHELAAAVAEEDGVLTLNTAGAAQPGDYMQAEKEVVRVEEVLDGGLRYRVTRGAHASTPEAQAAGTKLYHLKKQVVIAPFVRDFFGSPASGNWSHEIALPHARVASAEFFVTNDKGNSEVSSGCLTYNVDSGLRTFAGGQFSIQVDGFLAVDGAPVPELVVDTARSVRDIYAVVRQTADREILLRLTQNGEEYCRLAIPADAAISNVVDGFGLPPLEASARLALEVLAVGQYRAGADLTVVIRL